MFSKACEYGIRAMIHIAHQSQKGNRASLKGVAEAIDSPVAFTAKILQSLSKDNLITSIKGSGGGYELADPKSVGLTLHQVATSIDGDAIFSKCGLGLKECNESKPCPVHFRFKRIRDDLTDMMQSTTVADLASELDDGVAHLKI